MYQITTLIPFRGYSSLKLSFIFVFRGCSSLNEPQEKIFSHGSPEVRHENFHVGHILQEEARYRQICHNRRKTYASSRFFSKILSVPISPNPSRRLWFIPNYFECAINDVICQN
jgi:hypothetical protein